MSSTKTITIAPVKKAVTVEVSQERAFDVFTAGVDRWHRSFAPIAVGGYAV